MKASGGNKVGELQKRDGRHPQRRPMSCSEDRRHFDSLSGEFFNGRRYEALNPRVVTPRRHRPWDIDVLRRDSPVDQLNRAETFNE